MINIIFMGRIPFPEGPAMSKRHRYLIDYLRKQPNVRIFKYSSSWKNSNWKNPKEGYYKGCVYYVNNLYKKSLVSVIRVSVEACKYLKKYYKKGDKNVVLFSTLLQLEEIIPYIYAKLLGYKIVFDIVENYNAAGVKLSFNMWICEKMSSAFYRGSDGFFVISTLLKDLFDAKCSVPSCILPNSTPMTYINQKQHFSKPFKVVYTGTFALKDGVRFLVQGFNLFSQKVDSELLLIGKGELDQETDNIVRANASIKRTGYLSEEELRIHLTTADALVMPRCNSEFANYGFPFKLSEYLSTGNTVVATTVGDVTQYLIDKKNAFLIPPENVDAMAKVLEYIYTNEDFAIQVGKNGQAVVAEFFDVNTNGCKFLEFIKKI